MPTRKLLSQRHPALYFLAVWARRLRRYAAWFFDGRRYATRRSPDKLAFRVKKHQSVLLRKLGDSDPQLQHNKVTNLRLAAGRISGVCIGPGQTFSFCRLVGHPTRRKGYLPGME